MTLYSDDWSTLYPTPGKQTSPGPRDENSPGDEPAGASTESVVLDEIFNFQIVVFRVENTLFQVLRNGFNVPGTPFQGMFALPQATPDSANFSLEGSSLVNPIRLDGVKTADFRAFLRILYPFIDQNPVEKYSDWVGVLHLATMWFFTEIRNKAITALTGLIKEKSVFERIPLARDYRVSRWLQDAYVELAQKRPLTLDELHPSPTSFPLDWETIARIFYIRETAIGQSLSCDAWGCGGNSLCSHKAEVLATKIKEVFRSEFSEIEAPSPNTEPPLPDDILSEPKPVLTSSPTGKRNLKKFRRM